MLLKMADSGKPETNMHIPELGHDKETVHAANYWSLTMSKIQVTICR